MKRRLTVTVLGVLLATTAAAVAADRPAPRRNPPRAGH